MSKIRSSIIGSLCTLLVLMFASRASAEPTIDELRAKAETGDPKAEFGYGRAIADDPKRDKAEAAKWFRKAAEQGYARAQFRLGSSHEEPGMSDVEAIKWMRKAAEQDSECAFLLGFQYRYGHPPCSQDMAEAIKWFRKAAGSSDIKIRTMAESSLGKIFVSGEGVTEDNVEGMKWFRLAAEHGDPTSQYILGCSYMTGNGVLKDEVEGLAWLNLCVLSRNSTADVKARDLAESIVGRQAALAAQQRSRELLNQIEALKVSLRDGDIPQTKSASRSDLPKSSGTGTIISMLGHVLTAAHVVSGATKITVVTATGQRDASVLRIDEQNDVAVLKIEGGPYLPLPVAPSRRVRLGQSVATIGFPNVQIQGFSPKVTRGEISSLNGAADDPRSWQVSVPVQPGNSGGPLLDENGNLIGVVVSKLGLKAAEATGDMPQNVNYAVKSAYALALLEPYLDSNAPEPNQPNPKQTFADMVANAQQSVVLVLVY